MIRAIIERRGRVLCSHLATRVCGPRAARARAGTPGLLPPAQPWRDQPRRRRVSPSAAPGSRLALASCSAYGVRSAGGSGWPTIQVLRAHAQKNRPRTCRDSHNLLRPPPLRPGAQRLPARYATAHHRTRFSRAGAGKPALDVRGLQNESWFPRPRGKTGDIGVNGLWLGYDQQFHAALRV